MSAQSQLQQHEDMELKRLIDEFAELHLYLQSFQKEYDFKKKQLQEHVAANNSKSPLYIHGSDFTLEFSSSPQKSIIPDNLTPLDIYKRYGLGAFSPSVSNIKAIEAGRNKEFGFSPSILTLKWDTRRLLSAFKH